MNFPTWKRAHTHRHTDGFTPENLKYANYATNPLDDIRSPFRIHKLPISTLKHERLKGNVELSRKEMDRSKNSSHSCALLALHRPMEPRSTDSSEVCEGSGAGEANEIALRLVTTSPTRRKSSRRITLSRKPKSLRVISKDHRQRSDCDRVHHSVAAFRAPLFYGSYPIKPASDILH